LSSSGTTKTIKISPNRLSTSTFANFSIQIAATVMVAIAAAAVAITATVVTITTAAIAIAAVPVAFAAETPVATPSLPLASPSPGSPAPESPAPELQMSSLDAKPSEQHQSVSIVSIIPVAPPFSEYLPLLPYHVICRLCFHNSHSISYKQCPNCYKGNGGTDYLGW
jgi:hypothetical protein